MTRPHKEWNPQPAPFGNARGLDYVSLEVYIRIALHFDASIYYGELPPDIAAEQPANLAAARRTYGERHKDYGPADAFAAFTISQDGGRFSGEHADGNGHTSGYRGHYWADRIGPDTVVFDLRTVPDDRIVAFAVRGPMLDVTLPPGTVGGFDVDDLEYPFIQTLAENYLREYGGLEAAGYGKGE